MDLNAYCVIMAGGIGSRFWPLSRTDKPKQFLDILGTGKTLIQQTVSRFREICPLENIYIVTSTEYEGILKEQIPEILDSNILLEPLRKNTAPCIAYANHVIYRKNPDASVIVAPSDHLIMDEGDFRKVISKALGFVKGRDALLTLGIQPSRPETGYGYIQVDGATDIEGIECLRKVKTFTEKPDHDMARIFLESGDFFWNSGMFIWSLPAIMNAYSKYLPDMLTLFGDGMELYGTSEEAGFIQQVYGACDKISIDYGIMEKADNVFVMCADFGWSDLGTWGSLFEHLDKDNKGNSVNTPQFLSFDTRNCMIQVPDDKLAVIQGMEDYIIIDTEDVLLICKRSEEQNIRQMVDEVKIRGGEQYI